MTLPHLAIQYYKSHLPGVIRAVDPQTLFSTRIIYLQRHDPGEEGFWIHQPDPGNMFVYCNPSVFPRTRKPGLYVAIAVSDDHPTDDAGLRDALDCDVKVAELALQDILSYRSGWRRMLFRIRDYLAA